MALSTALQPRLVRAGIRDCLANTPAQELRVAVSTLRREIASPVTSRDDVVLYAVMAGMQRAALARRAA